MAIKTCDKTVPCTAYSSMPPETEKKTTLLHTEIHTDREAFLSNYAIPGAVMITLSFLHFHSIKTLQCFDKLHEILHQPANKDRRSTTIVCAKPPLSSPHPYTSLCHPQFPSRGSHSLHKQKCQATYFSFLSCRPSSLSLVMFRVDAKL